MFIGSILGLGLSPAMIAALGWPSVFHIFGGLGVAWYLAWRGRAASSPAEDAGISAAELAYVTANTAAGASKARSIPWRALLSRKEVWAIIVCHFCHNWGTFILLTWMPTYYNQVGVVLLVGEERGVFYFVFLGGRACFFSVRVCVWT
jgi:ACS family sodium-dependent inorganic phosphate cotransporter